MEALLLVLMLLKLFIRRGLDRLLDYNFNFVVWHWHLVPVIGNSFLVENHQNVQPIQLILGNFMFVFSRVFSRNAQDEIEE